MAMSAARARPLILAVDDEPANLALLQKIIRRLGYETIEATDGPGALESVAQHRPDLVLLDVMMPGIDGFEVCRRIRAQPELAGLPILLLTALDRAEDKWLGLEAGANDFLSKPFEEIELIARLRSLLRTKALQDRLSDVLGRYVSDAVVDRVLHDPVGALRLGGDRRRVTTLFADLRGYTALSASNPPEVILALLNRYVSSATDVILGRQGTVTHLLGDGIFAFFGAPVAQKDDTWRAVEAALALQQSVAALELPELPGIRLQTGVGITTGMVVVGNVGSERRMNYTVVGDPVNIAARLQTSAGPGQILVDEDTYGAVRDRVIAQDLGALRLTGKGELIRAFNVVAARPAVAPAPGTD